SWISIQRLISPLTNASYCASVISPFLHFVRVPLTSGVCGKLPIVVVGNNANCNFSSCNLIRSAKGKSRYASAFDTPATASRTSPFARYSACLLFSSSAAFANVSYTASLPSFKPYGNVTISNNFSSANDSPPKISGSIFFSKVFVTGTCNKEDDGCTINCASFTNCLIVSNVVNFSSKFARSEERRVGKEYIFRWLQSHCE